MPAQPRRALRIRPYRLLCTVCATGRLTQPDSATAELLGAIRACPDRPLQLVCDAGGVYAWQDPGAAGDSGEGSDSNRKRDLDILQRLDLPPGAILPARTLLHRVLKAITTTDGLCGQRDAADSGWAGCARAASGDYELGRAKGVAAIIPARDRAEMEAEKQRSIEALRSAEQVTIRPHLLMCAVCQYGAGVRPPLAEDNLPELLQVILTERPDLPITMSRGADWMMCAPCPNRVPQLNACVNVAGSGGLSNEKRDLDLLRVLGLGYGTTMPARALYLLLLERVPSTAPICARDNPPLSVWWDPCGEHNHADPRGNEGYRKGRTALLRQLRPPAE